MAQMDAASALQELIAGNRRYVAGEVAHEWRAHYQSPAERPERYGKAWAQKHPGARVETPTRLRTSTGCASASRTRARRLMGRRR